MSSPGYNLYVLAIVSLFFKTRYYAQDIFPDGKLFALNLEFFEMGFMANKLFSL